MQATVEISLYPLTENYAEVVIEFIQRLKRDTIRMEVNGLSTQLFGEYEELMDLLQAEARRLFSERKAVIVMKFTAGPDALTKERLPEVLKDKA